jgi:protein-S-isoprenylcysteine O-methyltransferase Ste14
VRHGRGRRAPRTLRGRHRRPHGVSVAALALSVAQHGLVFATPAGRAGAVALRGRPAVQQVADALFTGGVAAQLAAPALGLGGVLPRSERRVAPAAQAAALAVLAAAVPAGPVAQRAMGGAWNTAGTPTGDLVTRGPFALARNPIYSAQIAAAAAVAVLVPGRIALAGLAGLVAGIQLQVRAIEEPALRRAFGDAYAAYAARTGRFMPGVGQLSA